MPNEKPTEIRGDFLMHQEKTWKCPKCQKLEKLCKICEKSLLIKTEESFKEKPAALPEPSYGLFSGPRRRSKWDNPEEIGFDESMPLPAIEERMNGPIGFKVI